MPKIGIFMIHGTFGSPHEFERLESKLQSMGYFTQAISLPAHGDTPTHHLRDITTSLILKHCQTSFETFQAQCEQTIILGHSLGGICALLLAAQFNSPQLLGVISLSSPYEHAFWVNYPQGMLRINKAHLLNGLKFVPQSRNRFKTPRFRFWWINELKKQAREMFQQLPAALCTINAPVMLIHSPYDLIVPYGEMTKIARALTSARFIVKKTIYNCGHQILHGNDKAEAQCIMEIVNFLAMLNPVETK